MKPSEWADIAAIFRERWPHATMPVETIRRWGSDLADLDVGQVLASIEVMYRNGRAFPPNGGEVRSALHDLALDAPDWGSALLLLRKVALTRPVEVEWLEVDDDTVSPEVRRYPRRELLAQMETDVPLVHAFIDHVGWEQIRPTVLGADGSDEARLREKYVAFVKRAKREMTYAGLEGTGLPALERSAPRSISAVVGKIRSLGPG